jgi:hypothetical protein
MQNCSLLVAHERDEIRTKLPTLYVTLIKLVVSMFEFVESSKWKQAGS